MIVTMADFRAANFCMKGSRVWFRDHNLDWRDFAVHGIEAAALVETGDPLAARVVDVASARIQLMVDRIT